MGELVDSNQTVFIKGITENILLAHELVKNYYRNKGLADVQLKLISRVL